MNCYKAIDTYETTYSVWVQLQTYGVTGLRSPEIDFEPKISGLQKRDALFWALGQAQYMARNGSWKITENDLFEEKDEHYVILKNELGGRYSVYVAPDTVQADGTVTIKPTPMPFVLPEEKPNRSARKRRK